MSTIVALIGPIEFWWDVPNDPNRFMSPDAVAFRNYRSKMKADLAEAGYLVYAPWDAFYGPWDERAQVHNDFIINICDLVVCLRPYGIPGKGTDHEIDLALRLGKPVVNAPPGTHFSILEWHLKNNMGVINV